MDARGIDNGGGNLCGGWPSKKMSSSSDARRPRPTPTASAPNVSPRAGASVEADGVEPQARVMQLIRAAQAGDRGAFGQIVWMYQGRIYNALFRILGNEDDAAELCQEAFTRA